MCMIAVNAKAAAEMVAPAFNYCVGKGDPDDYRLSQTPIGSFYIDGKDLYFNLEIHYFLSSISGKEREIYQSRFQILEIKETHNTWEVEAIRVEGDDYFHAGDHILFLSMGKDGGVTEHHSYAVLSVNNYKGKPVSSFSQLKCEKIDFQATPYRNND